MEVHSSHRAVRESQPAGLLRAERTDRIHQTAGYDLLRILLGGVLLVAAGLKILQAHGLHPVGLNSLTAVVTLELLLGVLLLAGGGGGTFSNDSPGLPR